MRLVVNWSRCDGNGLCADKAPELLVMDNDDRPIVLQGEFGSVLRDKAEEAVRVCPKQALSLEE